MPPTAMRLERKLEANTQPLIRACKRHITQIPKSGHCERSVERQALSKSASKQGQTSRSVARTARMRFAITSRGSWP